MDFNFLKFYISRVLGNSVCYKCNIYFRIFICLISVIFLTDVTHDAHRQAVPQRNLETGRTICVAWRQFIVCQAVSGKIP